jgi:hypothetical protein
MSFQRTERSELKRRSILGPDFKEEDENSDWLKSSGASP